VSPRWSKCSPKSRGMCWTLRACQDEVAPVEEDSSLCPPDSISGAGARRCSAHKQKAEEQKVYTDGPRPVAIAPSARAGAARLPAGVGIRRAARRLARRDHRLAARIKWLAYDCTRIRSVRGVRSFPCGGGNSCKG
jgi:hypothetical protein